VRAIKALVRKIEYSNNRVFNARLWEYNSFIARFITLLNGLKRIPGGVIFQEFPLRIKLSQ
jgi:hypothetical protein